MNPHKSLPYGSDVFAVIRLTLKISLAKFPFVHHNLERTEVARGALGYSQGDIPDECA